MCWSGDGAGSLTGALSGGALNGAQESAGPASTETGLHQQGPHFSLTQLLSFHGEDRRSDVPSVSRLNLISQQKPKVNNRNSNLAD